MKKSSTTATAVQTPEQRRRDERLARAGWRVENHVLARKKLEDRLFLCRIELEAARLRVRQEGIQKLVGIRGGLPQGKRHRGPQTTPKLC
jgi:hypothetical protein